MTWPVFLALGALAWDAPPSCPSQADLQARVGEVHSRVDANVVALDGRFVLTVNIDDQVRTVTTATCAEAADTAVFLIELAAQRAPRRKAVTPTAPPLPPTDEPVVVKKRAPQREEPDPPPAPVNAPATGRFHLGAVGGVESILLPQPVARFGLFGQVDVGPIDQSARRPLIRVMLELRGAPSMRVNGGPTDDAAVVIAPFFDAQAGFCYLVRVGVLQLGPCAQAGIGVVWATGLNVLNPRGQGFAVWTASGGARLAISVTTHLEFQAFAMLRGGPRPRYVFEGSPAVVETSPVGLDTGLGVGARW